MTALDVAARTSSQWHVVGASVRGASHHRDGKPNQDAILWRPVTTPASRIAVAVADGHGSAAHPRSDVGAYCAVLAATSTIEQFLAEHAECPDLTSVLAAAERVIPDAIVTHWRRLIDDDLSAHPLAPASKTQTGSAQDVPGYEDDEVTGPASTSDNPYIAYGTTIVAAGICERFILLAQNGDGEFLAISSAGDVSAPLPPDPRLVANVTTSLCLPSAREDFRITVLRLDEDAAGQPDLLFLTTDGYPNSFVSDAEFHKNAADYLTLVHEHGLDRIGTELEGWLSNASKYGSGDDCTVLLVAKHPGTGAAAYGQAEGGTLFLEQAPPAVPPRAFATPIKECSEGLDTVPVGVGRQGHDGKARTPLRRLLAAIALILAALGLTILLMPAARERPAAAQFAKIDTSVLEHGTRPQDLSAVHGSAAAPGQPSAERSTLARLLRHGSALAHAPWPTASRVFAPAAVAPPRPDEIPVLADQRMGSR